jgi:urease accessory protein
MGMAGLWGIHMTDHLLTLMQWLSPAYPVGSFAWSHGLEQAVAAGQVHDAPSLQDWLAVVLEYGSGRSDAIVLCAAHRGEDVAALAAALAPSRERRMEMMQQGAAFAAMTRAVWGLDVPDLPYPVAVGRAAGLMGLAAEPVARAYLFSFMSSLTQAAQRLMPLGQTKGQQVLAALAPLCSSVAQDAAVLGIDDIGTSTFAVDIASMRHEVLEPRIFRS